MSVKGESDQTNVERIVSSGEKLLREEEQAREQIQEIYTELLVLKDTGSRIINEGQILVLSEQEGLDGT